MAKNVAGRVIFRKIGGRIVPIKFHNVADKAASTQFVKKRNIIATSKEFGHMGKLSLSIPKKGASADIDSVLVPSEFRKKGISKNLFKRATDFLERTKVKFLRSTDMQHHAQAKIRSGYGRYKAGKKGKSRTKFFADQFGAWGEETRRVPFRDAIGIIKENNSPRSTGRLVTATTMLRKKK